MNRIGVLKSDKDLEGLMHRTDSALLHAVRDTMRDRGMDGEAAGYMVVGGVGFRALMAHTINTDPLYSEYFKGKSAKKLQSFRSCLPTSDEIDIIVPQAAALEGEKLPLVYSTTIFEEITWPFFFMEYRPGVKVNDRGVEAKVDVFNSESGIGAIPIDSTTLQESVAVTFDGRPLNVASLPLLLATHLNPVAITDGRINKALLISAIMAPGEADVQRATELIFTGRQRVAEVLDDLDKKIGKLRRSPTMSNKKNETLAITIQHAGLPELRNYDDFVQKIPSKIQKSDITHVLNIGLRFGLGRDEIKSRIAQLAELFRESHRQYADQAPQ